jgi:hypothetical protein
MRLRALGPHHHTALTPVERVGALGDEWWMVRGGRHDIGVYLDLAGALATDETSAVVDTIAGRLSTTGEYIVSGPDRPKYEAWIRERFGPTLEALGLPGDLRDTMNVRAVAPSCSRLWV